jgi:hypothetical protein
MMDEELKMQVPSASYAILKALSQIRNPIWQFHEKERGLKIARSWPIPNPRSSSLDLLLSLFVGGADQDESSVRSGDGAFDKNEVVIGVNFDNSEIASSGAGVAVTARRFVAKLRSAAASIAGMGTNATGRSVMFFDSMTGRQTGEIVAFHGARRASSFAGAHHIDSLHVLKHLAGRQNGADLGIESFGQAELTDITLRLAIRLGGHSHSSRSASATPVRFQVGGNVPAFRPSSLATKLIHKPDLQRIIAVPLLFADLQHWARSHSQDCHRGQLPLFVVNLSHTDFQSQ